MKRTKSYSGSPTIVHDWSFLTGFHVQVQLYHMDLRSGKVEEVTRDGRALWVSAGGGFGRKLIDQGSGYQVLLDPNQLAVFRRSLASLTTQVVSPEPAKKR